MATRTGLMRHVVNVMQPTQATGSVGEAQGQDAVIRRAVPCSIETLTGNEAEQVHSTWPSATNKVEMYADRQRQITPVMYLTGGSLGTRLYSDGTVAARVLNIVGVIDREEKGLILTLICEEAQ